MRGNHGPLSHETRHWTRRRADTVPLHTHNRSQRTHSDTGRCLLPRDRCSSTSRPAHPQPDEVVESAARRRTRPPGWTHNGRLVDSQRVSRALSRAPAPARGGQTPWLCRGQRTAPPCPPKDDQEQARTQPRARARTLGVLCSAPSLTDYPRVMDSPTAPSRPAPAAIVARLRPGIDCNGLRSAPGS